MAKGRIGVRVLACFLLWGGVNSAWAAPPTPQQMMGFRPKLEGIAVSTPPEAELAACKVELIKGTKTGNGRTPSGWLLRDPQGKPLRRFFDSDGDNRIDVWSYYLDGQECYREIDSNFNEKVDQYRWLGPNGSKWGVDLNEDGRIDTWKVISPEEASQEVLQAVIARDFARLQALMITKAELDALELPESVAGRIRDGVAQAGPKFQKTTAALINLDAKTKWVHLEVQAPQTAAGDALGAKGDLVRYRNAGLMYSAGDKVDSLQLGDLIQVGRAWRIAAAPAPGFPVDAPEDKVADNTGSPNVKILKEIEPFLPELQKVDAEAPKGGAPADVVRYNLARAAVLEKIVGALKGDHKEDRDTWVRQLADCLSAAAQNSPNEPAAHARLVQWRDAIAKDGGSQSLVAYVTFREMSADYARNLATTKPAEMAKVQEVWRERLAKFVADFPAADDAPEALMQLGMISEFVGKETEAKNWYGHLVKHFKAHTLAPKAAGALKRLNSEGKELELAGPTLEGSTAFDIAKLKGKVVVVYYWASWNQQCAADFDKLKTIVSANGGKGVELVTVNLDNSAGEAVNFLRGKPIASTHLYQQPGGLDCPLAVNYGVMVLPNLFLVGRDGKVVSHTVQMSGLEDEIKKLMEK